MELNIDMALIKAIAKSKEGKNALINAHIENIKRLFNLNQDDVIEFIKSELIKKVSTPVDFVRMLEFDCRKESYLKLNNDILNPKICDYIGKRIDSDDERDFTMLYDWISSLPIGEQIFTIMGVDYLQVNNHRIFVNTTVRMTYRGDNDRSFDSIREVIDSHIGSRNSIPSWKACKCYSFGINRGRNIKLNLSIKVKRGYTLSSIIDAVLNRLDTDELHNQGIDYNYIMFGNRES